MNIIRGWRFDFRRAAMLMGFGIILFVHHVAAVFFHRGPAVLLGKTNRQGPKGQRESNHHNNGLLHFKTSFGVSC